MLTKKQYTIKSNIVKQPVHRFYVDIKWLHSALKTDYPGILMPPVPENTRDSLNKYFENLLLIDQLKTSHTLNCFVSCVSQQLFNEFKLKKQLKKGNINISTLLKDPKKFIIKNSISTKDLDEIVSRFGKLDDVPIKNRETFKDICFKVNEITEYSLLIFNEITNVIDTLKSQIEAVVKSFNHIADLFGNLALQSKKISSLPEVKQDPRLNYLNIEQVCLKYQSVFYNTGQFKRKCLQYPSAKHKMYQLLK